MRKSKYQPNYTKEVGHADVSDKKAETVTCAACGGSGKINGKTCTACFGSGKITVYK